MSKIKHRSNLVRHFTICLFVITLFSWVACDKTNSKKLATNIYVDIESDPGITVTPDLPSDIYDGVNATLSGAANFAWNEFIALNWSAVEQNGDVNTRDFADTTKLFGDQSTPLVWHTYRSKVEIFPWSSKYPNGTKLQGDTLLVFNYDALPKYFYKDSIPPCAELADDVAYINLDETSQISLNFMFAGVNPKTPTATNSSPQLIRFLAKGTRDYFNYVTGSDSITYVNPTTKDTAIIPKFRSYFNHGGTYYDNVTNYTNAIAKDTVAADSVTVNFPQGTVMIKAAWRLLTENDTVSQYHTANVRYYEKKNDNTCYYQDTKWGLVALHIAQKTTSAPYYFTFATFEQKDNLLTADGKPVEDADGKVINQSSTPTTPVVTHTDTPSETTTTITGDYCDAADDRLYYTNTAVGLPSDGSICVNDRYNNIPTPIINANIAAHNAIKKYNSDNNITDSPWENYKLVNIQYQPFNFDDIDDANNLQSTYYQANIVVETNYTLQKFSGQQIATGSEAGQTSNYANGVPFYNIHIPNGEKYNTLNMGGCMGCHGNAQAAGTDFSFMLRGGPVIEPDAPEIDSTNAAILAKKYRFN